MASQFCPHSSGPPISLATTFALPRLHRPPLSSLTTPDSDEERPIRTVQVRVVLQLVSEERSRNVDLLTSDDGDLLAGEDLLERRNEAGSEREDGAIGRCWKGRNYVSVMSSETFLRIPPSVARPPATSRANFAVQQTLAPAIFLPPTPLPARTPYPNTLPVHPIPPTFVAICNRARRLTCLETTEASRPRRWPLPSITTG